MLSSTPALNLEEMSKDQFTFDDTPETIHLQTAWDNALKRLSPEVPSAWMQRFLLPLKPVSIDAGVVTIATPGRFVMDWVRSRYQDALCTLLEDELGSEVVLQFEAESREKDAVMQEAEDTRLIRPAIDHGFRPNERYTFENFVVGQSNRMAVAGAKAVIASPGAKFNPLFIYGASGLGKTHLLHAMARELLAKDPRCPLKYISAQNFAEEFVTAIQSNKVDQFRRRQREVAIWLVDDVQFIAGKEKTQEEIFHTFNYLYGLGKQIVLVSDRGPRDLYLIEDRLRSRFESGLVADIQMPDTETRWAILRSKANLESIELPEEVALFLAENVPGNIRTLEGALTKLAVHASVSDQALSIDLAQILVDAHYRSGALAKPDFKTILDAVSKHFKIPIDDIQGKSRKAPIVHARHVAVYVTREVTGDSWKHIGSLFGDRDHTSMMHGYTKIHEMMVRDRDLRSAVKSLIRHLHPSQ